jgi:hypothetical protein
MDEVKEWQWTSAVLVIVAIIVLTAQILGPFFIHEFAIGVFYIPAILSLGIYLYLARISNRHST